MIFGDFVLRSSGKNNGNKIILIALSLIFMAFGIIVSVVFGVLFNERSTRVRYSDESRDIVERASSFIGSEEAYEASLSKLEAGLMEPGDYVESVLTGSGYLLENKDDTAFASDLAYVAWGDDYDDDDVDSIEDMLEDSSRKEVIANVLMEVSDDILSHNNYDREYTSVSDCSMTSHILGEDSYVIGIRQAEGTFEVTGDEIRTDFFVDGILYQGAIEYEQDGRESTFVLSWDTAGVTSGEHDVSILLRSSDGRGVVVDGGRVIIPEYKIINSDAVALGSLLMDREYVW